MEAANKYIGVLKVFSREFWNLITSTVAAKETKKNPDFPILQYGKGQCGLGQETVEKYSWLLYSLMSKGDKKYLSVLIHPDLTLNTVPSVKGTRVPWREVSG